MDISTALAALEQFRTDMSLRARIKQIEAAMKGTTREGYSEHNAAHGATIDALAGANHLKAALGQIHEIIHALGILLCLPHILEEGERIESLSLAAGNTGKDFDLETDRRIAEFTFINWRGGSETIRQNKIFKDFFHLAEADTTKQRWLYVAGDEIPRHFLHKSGRALDSVLKDHNVREDFYRRVGHDFATVKQYVSARAGCVGIRDVTPYVRDLDTVNTEEGIIE